MSFTINTMKSGLALGAILFVAPFGLVGQVPSDPPLPAEAPAMPTLDSLRTRLEALNREQIEEVRRVMEGRREEIEAVRDAMRRAIEGNEAQLEQARRNLEEVRRQSLELRVEAEALLQEALQQRQQLTRDQLSLRIPNDPSVEIPAWPGQRMEGWYDLRYLRSVPNFTFTGQRFVVGVELATLNPSLSGYFGVDAGVLVIEVVEGSPGARAGLVAGDVIVEVGGEPVTTVQEVRQAIGRGTAFEFQGGRLVDPPGNGVDLGIVREGERMEIRFTQ